MREQLIQVPTSEGPMETFVTHPEAGGPFPPVVLYMDIWGIREELYDLARRVAVVGYCAIVPDLYHRQGRVRNAFRDAAGRMMSVERLDEAQKAIIRAPLAKLSDAMVVADTAALLAALPDVTGARTGPIGSIGYCMGGRHVMRVATAFPDRFQASASLHGTELVTERDDSPHRAARAARGELYCGYGERDRFASPATIAGMRAAFPAGGRLAYSDAVHPGAHHGYALPDRDVYDKHAADRDWEHIFAMFRRRLDPPPHA